METGTTKNFKNSRMNGLLINNNKSKDICQVLDLLQVLSKPFPWVNSFDHNNIMNGYSYPPSFAYGKNERDKLNNVCKFTQVGLRNLLWSAGAVLTCVTWKHNCSSSHSSISFLYLFLFCLPSTRLCFATGKLSKSEDRPGPCLNEADVLIGREEENANKQMRVSISPMKTKTAAG